MDTEKQDYKKVQARLLAKHLIERENRQKCSKEEQIEEMAEIISDTEFVDLDGDTFCVCEFLDRVSTENIARELLKHYQPKLPEDSVVLSREEYEKLKLQIQEAHHKGVRVGFDLTKYKENQLSQTRKEMAREFYKKVRKLLKKS